MGQKKNPKIDRIACPWLVVRFIDRAPEFLFVSPSRVVAVAEENGRDSLRYSRR